MRQNYDDFISFARNHGLIVRNLEIGKITRCQTISHKNKRNGAFYFDGVFGWIQDWSINPNPIIWKPNSTNDIFDLELHIKQSKEKYAKDRAKSNADASKKARWILTQCKKELHAYLGRKGFPEMCSNVWFKDGAEPILVIPMYINKRLTGCQLIDVDGNKKFLSGQASKGAYFQIGTGAQVFFVEGYASALSLQKILASLKVSNRIVVCFSAGNLSNMSKGTGGFVIADNDESGAGEKAAIESGCNWWMPPIVGHDINDYHHDAGIFKVSQDLRKVIYSRAVG